jgi:hypothetical protein
MASEFGLDLTSVVSKREAIDLLFSNVDINDPSFIGAVQGAMDETICASTFEPQEVYEWIAYKNPNWTDAAGNIWNIEIAGGKETVEEIVNNINLIALPIEFDESENDYYYEPDGQHFDDDSDKPDYSIPSVQGRIELKHLESGGAHRVFFNLDPPLSQPGNIFHQFFFSLKGEDSSADLSVSVKRGGVGVSLYSADHSKRATFFARQASHSMSVKGKYFGIDLWLPTSQAEAEYFIDGDFVKKDV